MYTHTSSTSYWQLLNSKILSATLQKFTWTKKLIQNDFFGRSDGLLCILLLCYDLSCSHATNYNKLLSVQYRLEIRPLVKAILLWILHCYRILDIESEKLRHILDIFQLSPCSLTRVTRRAKRASGVRNILIRAKVSLEPRTFII